MATQAVKQLTESKSRKDAKNKPGKVCMRCKQTKELDDFFKNRDWEEQLGCDIWCKDCVSRIKTKDGMREYFWENNREWQEKIWNQASSKAEEAALTNAVYRNSNEERRAIILEQLTCQNVPSVMARSYKYVDNKRDDVLSYEDAKQKGLIKLEEEDPDLKVYSPEFNGYFKPAELSYLQNYYNSLCEDVEIVTQSHRDYAKKLAKASLQADKAQDDFAAGRCDYQLVKDSMANFDLLSKSANFAPSTKRKDGTTSGLGSFGEIALWLETNGYPCIKKVEWEPDDVDKTISEFSYLIESIGLDQV